MPVLARRVTLVVLPAQTSGMTQPNAAAGMETLVDSVDLSRPRMHRPAASGRSPLAEQERLAWPMPEAAFADSRR